MSAGFTGKVVLVTGGSSGIGRAVALELASRGARVALLARDRARLEAVAAEARQRGAETIVIAGDVADRREARAAVDGTVERWGRLDVLVNNAGYLVKGSVEDCPAQKFERQLAVNYLGAVYLTRAALAVMRARGRGSIVNVCSIAARVYVPATAAYQASKAALRAFTLTLHEELRGSGISVSLVTPGRTRTSIGGMASVHGLPPPEPHILGEMPPERVARAVVECAARPRREVVLPFAVRPLALAYTLAPGVVEAGLPWLQARWAALRGLPVGER